jgi:hypothetical protein
MNWRFWALAFATCMFLSAAKAQWVQTGFPLELDPRCIAADQGNLYVGTWGHGVYKSTDGGVSWTAANNGFIDWHYTGYVLSLVVAQSATGVGSILYAGMSEGGIWRSSDDAESWTWVYPGGVPGEYNISFYTLGAAGTTVVGGVRQQGTANGVYRSDDDGQTWTMANAGLTTDDDLNIDSFASIKAGGTTYLYVATDGGVFSSASGGTGWTRISSGLPAGVKVSSVIAVPNGTSLGITLLAGTWGQGVYRSTNNGVSWTASSDGFAWEGTGFGDKLYIEAFAASPALNGAPSMVFASAWPSVYLSTDGGLGWWATSWPWDTASLARALHINGGTLFAVSHAGQVWKYPAALDTGWVVQPSGTTDALLAVKAVNNSVVWAGGSHGGVFKTTTGGSTWTSVGGGNIGSDTVNAIDALDASTAFVTTYAGGTGKILRTTNGGGSWSVVASRTDVAFGGIQMKSAIEGYAVGTPVGGKWAAMRTTDGGGTWNLMATGPAEDSLTVMGIQYGGPYPMRPRGVQLLGNVLSFGSVSGIINRSTDFGLTWSSETTPLYINTVHFNSTTVGLAGSYVDGSTCYTENGGVSWDSASAVWSNPITCISGAGGEFWATSQSAIAYTNNLGHSWSFATPGYWGVFSRLQALSFPAAASPLNGWAVGDSGMILHYQRGPAASVLSDVESLPAELSLGQNYPNPFNPTTTIRFTIAGVVALSGSEGPATKVRLAVYDLLGREVAVLVNEKKEPGRYEAEWDGSKFASGVYLCRLTIGESIESRKMLLLR